MPVIAAVVVVGMNQHRVPFTALQNCQSPSLPPSAELPMLSSMYPTASVTVTAAFMCTGHRWMLCVGCVDAMRGVGSYGRVPSETGNALMLLPDGSSR